jgi:hypothetical protein
MGNLLSKVDKLTENAERASKKGNSYSHVDFLTRLESQLD